MAEVSLKKVRKVYNKETIAVSDFDLQVRDGEFVVLVGPSGCGKSTTLRLIAGLEELSEGEIYVDGVLANDLAPKDRDIAMVFQNYALYPHMTVYNNMAFALKLRKFEPSEIDIRVREAAEILNISELLDRKPKELSGGQQQRVAVGRAIVRKPKVFLFDEPLSNLDAKLRVQMRTEISKIHARLDATMIYVTHDQIEAMTMGDRLVVMNQGHIQQIGSPMDLYRRPANQFVAEFIGSPSMNFIEGILVHVNQRLAIMHQKSKLPLSGLKPAGLQDHLDKPVVLGIRPENIECSPDLESRPIVVTVEVVEQLGNETHLYLDLNGKSVVARSAADLPPVVGDRISLEFDPSAIHLFDADTGISLLDQSRTKP